MEPIHSRCWHRLRLPELRISRSREDSRRGLPIPMLAGRLSLSLLTRIEYTVKAKLRIELSGLWMRGLERPCDDFSPRRTRSKRDCKVEEAQRRRAQMAVGVDTQITPMTEVESIPRVVKVLDCRRHPRSEGKLSIRM